MNIKDTRHQHLIANLELFETMAAFYLHDLEQSKPTELELSSALLACSMSKLGQVREQDTDACKKAQELERMGVKRW